MFANKTPKPLTSIRSQEPSQTASTASVAPPSYGIDFVDSGGFKPANAELATASPIQRVKKPGLGVPARVGGDVVQRYVSWADEDHELRAITLAKELKEGGGPLYESYLDLSTSTDTTLTIWGHGSADALGDYDPKGLAMRLRAIGVEESAINTVELVTCDAANPNYETGQTSFASALDTYLKDHEISLTVKALPPGGGNSKSIFYFFANGVYAYVTMGSRTDLNNFVTWKKANAPSAQEIQTEAESRGGSAELGHIRDIRSLMQTVGQAESESVVSSILSTVGSYLFGGEKPKSD